MRKYLLVCETLITHDGSTYLAESYAMSPPLAMKDEGMVGTLDGEGRGIEMGRGQPLAYLKFFAYGHGALGATNGEFDDTTRRTNLNWCEFKDLSEVYSTLTRDERGQFGEGVFDGPTVEIDSLPVVAIEDLRENTSVTSVAIGVSHCDEIRMVSVVPTTLVLFKNTTTALGEAGIANGVVVGEDLATSVTNDIADLCPSLSILAGS